MGEQRLIEHARAARRAGRAVRVARFGFQALAVLALVLFFPDLGTPAFYRDLFLIGGGLYLIFALPGREGDPGERRLWALALIVWALAMMLMFGR